MTTPRARRQDITRRKILDTAREILVTEGLQNLSMRSLAEKIDYSPAAIYKYFGSKEEILQAIREEGWARISAVRPESSSEKLSPPQMLYESGKDYLAFAARYPEYYLLMFNVPEAFPGGIAEISADARFTGLIRAVQQGVDAGYFKLPEGYTPQLMAFQFWITVHGMVMLRISLMRDAGAEFDQLCHQIIKAAVDNITVRGSTE